MSFIPGLGMAKGMALTMRRFFAPKATVQYPETAPDVAVRFRGRLQLLYDELGNLKCETCFQCAQACPVECIDMGGFDTKGRFHVHWGAAEQYAERREGSALRRSGRPVPDTAFTHFAPIDLAPVDEILKKYDFDQKEMLGILESIQRAYGHLPVAALKRVSEVSGAPYALIYGTATYYRHLRFDRPSHTVAVCLCTAKDVGQPRNPEERAEAVSRAKAIVIATTHFADAKIVADAAETVTGSMKGLAAAAIEEKDLMQTRGW